MCDRTLCQACRVPWHFVDVCEEPIRQHVRLGSGFLQVVLPVALDDSFDMRQAFRDKPLVQPQEPRQRDSEVPVVIDANNLATDLNILGVYEPHIETAAELEALPSEVTTRYYPQYTPLEPNGRGRSISPTSAAPRRSRGGLLRKRENLSSCTQALTYDDMFVRPSDDLPIQCPQRQPNLAFPRDFRTGVLLRVLLHLGNISEGGEIPVIKPDSLKSVSLSLS